MSAAQDARLEAGLDVPLGHEVAVGAGTALFVAGWCYCPQARIRRLLLIANGDRRPVAAHGMPRLDLFRSLHPDLDPFATGGLERDPGSPRDPLLHGYRSGFWGLARLGPSAAPTATIALHAELEGGGTARTELATLRRAPTPKPLSLAAPDARAGAFVAICMATCDPVPQLLRRQIDTIRAQSHPNWVCIVSDDASRPQRLAAIEDALASDPRFVLSRAPRRAGFTANFERALGLVPHAAEVVALSDQDDAWHPDKLATLLGALGDAELAYSDARVVDDRGAVLADRYWASRRNEHEDVLSLLVANAVTGAASLFRRELLDVALPFPAAQFAHYHDHWLALCARAMGTIAYVDRPLYDYVQHGAAALGHERATHGAMAPDGSGGLHGRVRAARQHYFADACRLLQLAAILDQRCGPRMAPGARTALERFARADRSPAAAAALWLRGARDLAGRPRTLGAERGLGRAFAWRHALAASARDRPARALRLDALPPARLAPAPARREPEGPVRALAEKIAPLDLDVRADAPARVNLLVPTIDLEHFFGGYIAKFNLARRLAERGLRVRIVTVDPVPELRSSWRAVLEGYAGLQGVLDRVEVVFGREATAGVEVSPADRFVATTWWTAHAAADAARRLDGPPFVYLIQEYEPFTFAMGSLAALADGSYRLPHRAVFSTELLRDFFRRRGIGVYAGDVAAADASSVSFQNAITRVPAPTAGELQARTSRRLLLYARPESHAARNMFEVGVLALVRALDDGTFDGWELRGIGSVDGGRRVDLGAGASLELLPRSGQTAYADVLLGHDVGLALMYTPHPSLVPIEMASAGMLTVTNTFENKTAGALAAISPNLVAVEPTVEAIAAGLREAAAAAGDAERRARGSAVRWSRDWDESFGDDVLDRVVAFLGD